MLALRPPFFAFTLFSPFVLSRFFSFFFSAPFPLGPSLFSPPILCPFPGCVFYPRLSAPFSLSLTGFPLLLAPFSHLFSPVSSPFSFLPAVRLLSFLHFPPSLLALPLCFPCSFSVLLLLFPLAPSPVCSRPFPSLLRLALTHPLSSPSPHFPLSLPSGFLPLFAPAFPLPRASG